ncbi:DUF5615 family PIN-like protein [Candidatus Amarobacter glycogenicus]|uniref:DUF5615 family PIN-like protein n=1 Tax=Candidatus Amarobacter glycogenicus TaxID=3140699 RepID=UPI0031CC98D9
MRGGGADVSSRCRQRAPDHEQLVFATAQERAIYTANRPDFARLRRVDGNGPKPLGRHHQVSAAD